MCGIGRFARLMLGGIQGLRRVQVPTSLCFRVHGAAKEPNDLSVEGAQVLLSVLHEGFV